MKTTFTRILVPMDFSAASDQALSYAKTLAEAFGASVHLLHVLEPPVAAGPWGSELYIQQLPRMREIAEKEAQRRLDQSKPANGTSEIADGGVARTIIDTALARDTDLIVMGTHGRTGIAHALLGSVAERVIRTASVPVLVVRAPEPASDARSVA